MGASSEELTCRELVELVTEYLEGSLPPDERRRFEEHLVRCPGCDAHLEQMRETLRLLGRLPEDSLRPGAKEALLRAFEGWKTGR